MGNTRHCRSEIENGGERGEPQRARAHALCSRAGSRKRLATDDDGRDDDDGVEAGVLLLPPRDQGERLLVCIKMCGRACFSDFPFFVFVFSFGAIFDISHGRNRFSHLLVFPQSIWQMDGFIVRVFHREIDRYEFIPDSRHFRVFLAKLTPRASFGAP